MGNGQIRLPPDGTGKQTQTFTYTSGSDTIHQQAVVLTDAENPTRYQKIDQYGAQYVRYSEGDQQIDALGNSKFSQLKMIQHYGYRYNINNSHETDFTEIGGTIYTSSIVPTHGMTFEVNTTSGSRAWRRTNKWHKISQAAGGLVEISVFHGDDGKDGVVRRWGYYDDNYGFLFQLSGSEYYCGVRNHQDDPITTWYSQSEWTVDQLDGTGPSGFIATPTNVRRYWVDWKPIGGRVRFGIYDTIGQRLVFHEAYNYYQRSDLPITWETFNIDNTASPSIMTIGDSHVMQEGIQERHGKISTSYPGVWFTIPTGEDVTLFSIRSKEQFGGHTNRVAAIPKSVSAVCTHNTSFRLIKNGQVSGSTYVFQTLPSASFIGDSTGVWTGGGEVLLNWFVAASSSLYQTPTEIFGVDKDYIHTWAYASQSEEYSIIASIQDPFGSSGSFAVSFTWEEIY